MFKRYLNSTYDAIDKTCSAILKKNPFINRVAHTIAPLKTDTITENIKTVDTTTLNAIIKSIRIRNITYGIIDIKIHMIGNNISEIIFPAVFISSPVV